MEYRELGATGVEVSKLSLGAMMFGAWGNPDHDDGDPDHPRRARRRDQRRRHRRRLLGRRDRGDRRQGARRAARRGRAGDEVPRPDGRGPEPERQLAALDHAGGRGEPPPPEHRLDRHLPGAPPRARHRRRRDARRAHRPRPRREDPLPRQLDLPGATRSSRRSGSAERRGRERFRCEQPPYSMLVRGHRARRAPDLRALRDGRDLVEPARRRLALGPLPHGSRAPGEHRSEPHSVALRHVAARRTSASSRPPSSSPCSPRRPGLSLVHLAIAFVVNHPAVTSAIIGPRTMEHLESQLGAADVVLTRRRARPHRRDHLPGHELEPARRRLPAARGRRPDSPPRTADAVSPTDVNVVGRELLPCSAEPLTGFYRNGCCSTGPEDIGSHTVCVS